MGKGRNRNHLCSCGSGRKHKHCCRGKSPAPVHAPVKWVEDEKLAGIIDTLTDEYVDDPQVVFRDESDQKRAYFAQVKAGQKDWERSRICMFPGCNKASIKRSHTVPRSMLSLVAEAGHVLHANFNQSDGRFELARVGVKEASTFAGFCEEHELVFQRFESCVQMRDETDVILQLFRTVCREVSEKEHRLRTIAQHTEELRNRRNEWGLKRFDAVLRESFKDYGDTHLISLDIQANDPVTTLERKRDETETDLASFKRSFFNPFLDALDKGGKLKLNVFHHTLDERLPVALAGRGNFGIHQKENATLSKTIHAVMNVLPTKAGTKLYMCVPQDNSQYLSVYVRQFLGTGAEADREGVLRMVESWMLHGTDHWFISPSAWGALSKRQQSSAIDEFLDVSKDIGAQPLVPLLDSVRKKRSLV